EPLLPSAATRSSRELAPHPETRSGRTAAAAPSPPGATRTTDAIHRSADGRACSAGPDGCAGTPTRSPDPSADVHDEFAWPMPPCATTPRSTTAQPRSGPATRRSAPTDGGGNDNPGSGSRSAAAGGSVVAHPRHASQDRQRFGDSEI